MTPATPARLARIGYPLLVPVSVGQGDDFLDALREGLAEHGYHDGTNVAVEMRDAGGDTEQLPRILQELIDLPVDVFVLPLSNTVPMAAAATKTILIVSTLIGDPVALGLVQSLARPTANVTGLTVYYAPRTGKRLELLKEAVPAAVRVGLLRNTSYPETDQDWREAQAVAPKLGLDLVALEFAQPAEMLSALETGVRRGIDALVVVPDAVSASRYAAIVRFATEHQLPGVYHHERFADPAMADPGGLVAFGPDRFYNFRRAGFYVDRLLKGTRPQDLPFEQPTRYRLVISRRAARQLGVDLPQARLGQ
ncbi:MAG TPA: ABC transporter substrate-binding protein, partial [Chloroflexota bacterium]